jgi:YidC/Oxa1 family membrane protein insertase
MEKRVFLAIFLSFIVLVVYQSMVGPPPASPPADLPAAPAGTGAASSPAGAAVLPAQPPAVPTAVVVDPGATDVVVDTDAIRAVFTTGGATLKSLVLKHYLDNGQPLEFIPQNVPDTLPRPFTLATNDPALSARLATAVYSASAPNLSLGTAPGRLSFEYTDQSGVTARKTFFFQPEGRAYVLKVEASIDVAGASRPTTLISGPALALGYDPENKSAKPARAVQWRDGSVDRLDAGDLSERARYEGEFRFAGAEDQYFLNAVLPGTQTVAIEYTPISLPVPGDATGRTRTFVSYSVTAPGSAAFQYFLGPKDFDILRAVDPRLELVRAIDFGIFTWLVVPLLQALKWINRFVGNYGWSIILLTIFINLVIFPLRHRSMVSMRKMQALQPEMKAIQERYAKYKVTDPERQKMNQEMMALYKQRGVNPASGCVPMLLTMPVLFAFYSMLYAAIELRGAPFVGWITDLSRHDPWYVTPILMGLSMLWQQRITPTTADPVQQKIFMLMPVFFLVFFLWAPSGLVIYWLVSNLLAIGQQYVTNRLIGAPALPARPPVSRPAKAANSAGKS